MIGCIEWLIEGSKSGDSLFLHYSGHGATQPDQGPIFDEPTGMDECWVPFDFQVFVLLCSFLLFCLLKHLTQQANGMLCDDDLHDMLVKPLPAGVR